MTDQTKPKRQRKQKVQPIVTEATTVSEKPVKKPRAPRKQKPVVVESVVEQVSQPEVAPAMVEVKEPVAVATKPETANFVIGPKAEETRMEFVSTTPLPQKVESSDFGVISKPDEEQFERQTLWQRVKKFFGW